MNPVGKPLPFALNILRRLFQVRLLLDTVRMDRLIVVFASHEVTNPGCALATEAFGTKIVTNFPVTRTVLFRLMTFQFKVFQERFAHLRGVLSDAPHLALIVSQMSVVVKYWAEQFRCLIYPVVLSLRVFLA